MKNQWWNFSFFLFPFLWMGFITFLSSQSILPSADVFWQDFIIKKTAHLVVYMILFWSWFLAFRLSHPQPEKTTRQLFLIIILCLVFAIFDEWHQSFVPGRTGTLRDVGYDFLGISLAALWSYRII